MPLLTFVIPVRHQDNAADWGRLSRYLAQTLASIAAQTHDDWRGVVVANEGAELPAMPDRFHVERVAFPPNQLHKKGEASRDDFLDAFRIDKGRRVLAGMLSVPDTQHYMIVDDDDFIHRDLVRFVASQKPLPGWKVDRGYAWSDGTNVLYALDGFHLICGTSLIIAAETYQLPRNAETADRDFVMQMLGSHQGVERLLADRGIALSPLPFRAAVYRVGNPGSHSRTPGVIRRFVFAHGWKRRPHKVLRGLSRLRWATGELRERFGL